MQKYLEVGLLARRSKWNIGVINIADIDELGINYSQLDYIEESERKSADIY